MASITSNNSNRGFYQQTLPTLQNSKVNWPGMKVSSISQAILRMNAEIQSASKSQGFCHCITAPLSWLCCLSGDNPNATDFETYDPQARKEELIRQYRHLQRDAEIPREFFLKYISFMNLNEESYKVLSFEQLTLLYQNLSQEDWNAFFSDYEQAHPNKSRVVRAWIGLRHQNSEQVVATLSHKWLSPYFKDPKIAENFLQKIHSEHLASKEVVQLLIDLLPIQWQMISFVGNEKDQVTALTILISRIHKGATFAQAHHEVGPLLRVFKNNGGVHPVEKANPLKGPPKSITSKFIAIQLMQSITKKKLPKDFISAAARAESIREKFSTMPIPIADEDQQELESLLLQMLMERLTNKNLPDAWTIYYKKQGTLGFQACVKKAAENPQLAQHIVQDPIISQLFQNALEYKSQMN